jgi:MFS family permease
MLGWFAELNPKERRTMGACFGGWALDAFDVQMYSFVIPTVITLWGLSRGQAGLIGTVTLLISSLGGWFSGTLADRFGRVRMLQITILWYSVFTFLCAFAQNFEQLFVLRALHGLGFGGEWAAGAVLMGEVIRDKYRGRGVGIVQTGWAVGWGASALVYTGLYAFLPRRSHGARCSRSAYFPRSLSSGSAATSRSPRSSATRAATARRSV